MLVKGATVEQIAGVIWNTIPKLSSMCHLENGSYRDFVQATMCKHLSVVYNQKIPMSYLTVVLNTEHYI